MLLSNLYGIDANSLGAPYSLLASVLLILGLTQLGLVLEKITSPAQFDNSNTDRFCIHKVAIAPIYGICLVGTLLFPLSLFSSHSRLLIFSISLLLCMSGIYFTYTSIRLCDFQKIQSFSLRNTAKVISAPQCFCLILLLSYALLASSPPTDADDLDYHSGVALALLNQGTWPFSPEWFTSRLAGLGEALIAIGYSIGAIQFGSLLQFSGLVCIFSLLTMQCKRHSASSNYILGLIFLSSPVLLWLTSTSKPLLLPIAMTSLGLYLVTRLLDEPTIKKSNALINFSIAILLITLASQMKFNFLLSGFLVGVASIHVMYQLNLLRMAIPIATLISAVNLLPFSIWKKIHYGGNWLSNLYTLFPGDWAGYSTFESYLRQYDESTFVFPLSLLISTPSQITNIIGFGVVAWLIAITWLFFNRSKLSNGTKTIACASIVLVILGSSLGQHGGRFYLEPLAWGLMAIAISGNTPPIFMSRLGSALIYIQGAFTLLGLSICIWALLPGSLNQGWYQSVMLKKAFQYPEMAAIDNTIPENAVLLTDARSIALSPRVSVSTFYWPNYIDLKSQEYIQYLDLTKKAGITHFQTRHDIASSPWKDCIKQAPIDITQSQHNSRNPLNAGAPYQVWLYAFDSSKLPDCFKLPK